MNYNIILTDTFKKEAKKLLKKYPSLSKELSNLGKELQENPTKGVSLGNDVYKIRIAISSKNKGKSGGARIISFVKVVEKNVFLVNIYSKGVRDSISSKEIAEILKLENII
ncbi:type II toxin-antitoxin system RelE/ParE family toxin [Pedobacter lithocola]|uniref:Type II toxin-antitoxin system RelE/ParE family toxin n=1 Tax=Pedobacter lithocola TaxID=1908239 RepID=A0ABV8P504_9SPHI